MPIRVGQATVDPARIYIGDTRIVRAYLGTDLVWGTLPVLAQPAAPMLTYDATQQEIVATVAAVSGATGYEFSFARGVSGTFISEGRSVSRTVRINARTPGTK